MGTWVLVLAVALSSPGHLPWWHILYGILVLQKPLVRHPGDALNLEKVRQCEIHMQPKRDNCCRTWLSKFPTRSKRIDVISRITFPLVFALFNLVYWSTYLFREEAEENWATTVPGTKQWSSPVHHNHSINQLAIIGISQIVTLTESGLTFINNSCMIVMVQGTL